MITGIRKTTRPILEIFVNYKGSFSNEDKMKINDYLKTVFSPIQRLTEVSVEKNEKGLIEIIDTCSNRHLSSIYMKEIEILLYEH